MLRLFLIKGKKINYVPHYPLYEINKGVFTMDKLLKIINDRYDDNYQSLNELPSVYLLDILDMNVELIYDSNETIVDVILPSNMK